MTPKPTKETRDEVAERRLKDLSARVGEHFGEYLLAVRSDGILKWRFSDRTFAHGAVGRIQDRLREQDSMELRGD
jgi:hypothetical protein